MSDVSRVTGRRQRPALRFAVRLAFGLALIGALELGAISTVTATAAVVIVVGAPLLRVVWLIGRWIQEGDRRFILTGVALLAVVGAGAVLSVVFRS